MDPLAELDQLDAELRNLMASFEFAFAFGHGCSLGDHPTFWLIRDRYQKLTARISELRSQTVVRRDQGGLA